MIYQRFVSVVCFICLSAACVSGGGGGEGSGDNDGNNIGMADAVEGGDSVAGTDVPATLDTWNPNQDAGPVPDSGAQPVDAGVQPPPSSAKVDPNCLDGQYSEPLPTPNADISGLISGYSAANYVDFIMDVLEARYPVGAHLVEGGLANQQIGHCIDFFLSNKNSAQAVIKQMSTIVHECGHFYDIGESGFDGSKFIITKELTLSCNGGNKFEYGGNTFVRAELTNDTFSDDYPPCPEGSFGGDCDFYASTYLTGDSGNQGFNMLFEEVVQYVNSLATGYAFNDFYAGSTSERDGILTFLWYLERYLYLARTEYPETYQFLSSSACWREAILTVWGRAWIYLETTKELAALGINDDKLMGLVETPELLAEIESLRNLHGCN